jgi:hypothetical protein
LNKGTPNIAKKQENGQKSNCYRTQGVDLRQESGCFQKKHLHNYCLEREIVVPLHRQKVNRLFRLVVIDLGF